MSYFSKEGPTSNLDMVLNAGLFFVFFCFALGVHSNDPPAAGALTGNPSDSQTHATLRKKSKLMHSSAVIGLNSQDREC